MAFATQATGPVVTAPSKMRFGTMCARIASNHRHRLGVNTTYGRVDSYVSARVNECNRHPEEAAKAKWICKSPHCAGKHWPAKAALLKDHPSELELKRNQEQHLFMAVYEAEAVPEKRDAKTGEVLQEGKPAVVLLLSDEE